jgi:hypothetical protein
MEGSKTPDNRHQTSDTRPPTKSNIDLQRKEKKPEPRVNHTGDEMPGMDHAKDGKMPMAPPPNNH